VPQQTQGPLLEMVAVCPEEVADVLRRGGNEAWPAGYAPGRRREEGGVRFLHWSTEGALGVTVYEETSLERACHFCFEDREIAACS